MFFYEFLLEIWKFWIFAKFMMLFSKVPRIEKMKMTKIGMLFRLKMFLFGGWVKRFELSRI